MRNIQGVYYKYDISIDDQVNEQTDRHSWSGNATILCY